MKQPPLRAALLAGVALLAFAVALITWATGALSGLEGQALSARFSIRGNDPAPRNVVIVGVDNRAFQYLKERPPIRRGDFARLLNALHAAGARVIGVDFTFDEPVSRAGDGELLAAIARDGPVVLGSTPGQERQGWHVQQTAAHGDIAPFGFEPDRYGGIVRMSYVETDPGFPALWVRTAQLAGAHVTPRQFPGNQAWIDFHQAAPYFSMADVLAGRVPRQAIAGKVVLVGNYDPAEHDYHQTAGGYMFGTDAITNAVATIFDGFPLGSLGGAGVVVLLALMASIPPLLAMRVSALYVLAVGLVLLVVFLIVNQLAFDSGTIVPVPDPILALALGTAGAIGADAFVSRRQLRKLLGFLELPGAAFFISYRHGPDDFVANTLRDQLVEKFGPESVFKDDRSIDAGSEFPQRIEDAIASARAVLVVMGPGWHEVRSGDGQLRLFDEKDWVRREIETALAHEGVTIVPVRWGGARMPSRDELPPTIQELCNKHAVELTGRDLRQEIDELVGSMERGRLRDFVARAEPLKI